MINDNCCRFMLSCGDTKTTRLVVSLPKRKKQMTVRTQKVKPPPNWKKHDVADIFHQWWSVASMNNETQESIEHHAKLLKYMVDWITVFDEMELKKAKHINGQNKDMDMYFESLKKQREESSQ